MTRRTVFVDTWQWVAAAVRTDPNHARARALEADLLRDGALRVTSNFVLSETLTRLRYNASLGAALRVANLVEDMVAGGLVDVILVDDAIWRDALTWFRRFDDQTFSFVDCTSFAIMSDLAITEALTADRHFATAGFTPLGAG